MCRNKEAATETNKFRDKYRKTEAEISFCSCEIFLTPA